MVRHIIIDAGDQRIHMGGQGPRAGQPVTLVEQDAAGIGAPLFQRLAQHGDDGGAGRLAVTARSGNAGGHAGPQAGKREGGHRRCLGSRGERRRHGAAVS